MLSIDVAKKELRENLRDRRSLIFLVILPAILIVFSSFTFGSGTFLSGGSLPHEVAVINNDAGVELAVNNTTQYVNYGANFTSVLENVAQENSTTHLFHLNDVSEAKAEDLLKSRSIDALIIIPKNFSAGITALVNNSTRAAITLSVGQQTIANTRNLASNTVASDAALGSRLNGAAAPPVSAPHAGVLLPAAKNTTTTLLVQGDAGYMNFATAQALIRQIFDQYTTGIQANATSRVAPEERNSILTNPVSIETLALAGTQSFSLFDYLVPGLIVYSVLTQMCLVSSSLVREIERGTLNRLKLSKLRAFDLFSGTFMTWTIIVVGQIVVLIAVAIMLGYKYQADITALSLAVLIGAIAGMASIALALLIASFARNDIQAILLGAMLSVPLGFMAGAFFPLPRQVLADFAGRTYTVYDVLPWTWAVSALRSVLTYGSGLSADVVFDLAWLILSTVILFVIGVTTYSRVRLRAER
jgi:ABC-2 type transport system permease protein